MIKAHPYSEFVSSVQKPARYLGGEFGAVVKSWDDPQIVCKVALGFPDVYDIGMSHLGLKILYSLLNSQPDLLAERVFSPWLDMEAALRARDLPLVSLETARPLREFDVVGLSLQFELTYANCLQILDLGRIPLRSAARGNDDPLVVAGGPTATHPEPLAPFLDAVVIGDGEEAFPELLRVWARTKGIPRRDRLMRLAKITGVYVPSLYELAECEATGLQYVSKAQEGAPLPVSRALVADINRFPFPSDGPVSASEAVFDRISVEIARGCTEGCRFCQAGMIYRPVRERDPEAVIASVMESLKRGGYDEVALTSLSTADYSCVSPLVREVMGRLEKERVSLSVSSLRAYGLQEELLDEIQKVRATGLTFAPEAGTQRMRDVINKNITEEQLMTTAERVFSRGWSKMKLYFMIGLPTERDEDVHGIVETGSRALAVGKQVQRGRPPTVTVSVSTHVPKPHTPFQWAALDSLPEIHRKQAILRGDAKRLKVDLKTHEAEGSVLEGVLARGDRRLADVVEHAYLAGARFDSWDEHARLELWQAAFDATGIPMSRYLGTLPLSAKLPWGHIDVGLEDGFLAREYRKALKDQLSPPCGKAAGAFVHHSNLEESHADKRKLVCYDCGVACDLGAMRDERLVYLKKLGANGPVVIDLEKRRAKKPEERRPKVKFEQAEGARYRITYTKAGTAAFLSHLDVLRALPRMFRRAGATLHYSQGFHPKPELTFGPALSLGVASLCEVVDVKLAFSGDEATLKQSLQGPEGLEILSLIKLEDGETNIAKLFGDGALARYVVALPKKQFLDTHTGRALCSSEGGLLAGLTREIEGQLEGGRLSVIRTIDGLGKRIDVRSYLVSMIAGRGQEDLERAGIVGDLLPIEIVVRLSNSGGVKVSEVVEAVLGVDTPFRAVRSRMWVPTPIGVTTFLAEDRRNTRGHRQAESSPETHAMI